MDGCEISQCAVTQAVACDISIARVEAVTASATQAWCTVELCKFETASLASITIISDENSSPQVVVLDVEQWFLLFMSIPSLLNPPPSHEK